MEPAFFSSETITAKDIETIFEAGRWAPSGHNHQPWYFYYVKKNTASYKKLFTTLNDYNQSWAKTAPVLILACAIEPQKNTFAFYDLGAAVISLILQAQALGYYSRQMVLFDRKKVKKIFKLNKNLEPFVVIAMGKIGDHRNTPKDIVRMELDPRPRKTDIFKEV
jgi:nitroreductase